MNHLAKEMCKEQNSVEPSNLPPLKYQELLEEFMDVINEQFHPENKTLFRWSHHPTTDDDFTPQIFQQKLADTKGAIEKPHHDASKEVILDYINQFTISVFDTEEHAVQAYQAICRKMKVAARLESFKQHKGEFVYRIKVTDTMGLLDEASASGHIQILLREGVTKENLIDKSFHPKKIDLT